MAETSRWHRGLPSVDRSPRRLARAAARIGSSSARTRVARPCGPSDLPSDRRQRAVMPGCQEKPSSQAGTRTCHWHLCPASPRDPLCARNRARKTRRPSKILCGAARRRVCSLSTVAKAVGRCQLTPRDSAAPPGRCRSQVSRHKSCRPKSSGWRTHRLGST